MTTMYWTEADAPTKNCFRDDVIRCDVCGLSVVKRTVALVKVVDRPKGFLRKERSHTVMYDLCCKRCLADFVEEHPDEQITFVMMGHARKEV